jgi:hypothetical protein
MSILGLVNSPECCRRKQVLETASHVVWLWRFARITIQATGSNFFLTRWPWGHLCQQDVALCSKCGAAEGMNIRAAQRSIWSKCIGHCGACLASVLFCCTLKDVCLFWWSWRQPMMQSFREILHYLLCLWCHHWYSCAYCIFRTTAIIIWNLQYIFILT